MTHGQSGHVGVQQRGDHVCREQRLQEGHIHLGGQLCIPHHFHAAAKGGKTDRLTTREAGETDRRTTREAGETDLQTDY